MQWHIVYKGKATTGTLKDNLSKAEITYYIPIQKVEQLVGDRIEEKEIPVLTNLIFIQTDKKLESVIDSVNGLKAPYLNQATGRPAVVSDEELQRFRQVLHAKSLNAAFLPDAISRFDSCPKVRVKAGDFAGMEGYVFRIRGDRKLVIKLGEMAVAISGIHHTLLEIIE